jgi:predicted GNAT family N-acyltransferase
MAWALKKCCRESGKQVCIKLKPTDNAMSTMHNSDETRFVIRLAETVSELKEVLKVRYELMRHEFPIYVPENACKIDLDQWDMQAYHMGLWKLANGTKEAIGYMRAIQAKPLPVGNKIFELKQEFPILELQSHKTSTSPVKCMDKYLNCSDTEPLYKNLPKKKIVEGSRLGIFNEYRTTNPGRFLVETSFALFLNPNMYPHCLIDIREHHFPAYYRYGFRKVASVHVPEDGCNHILCYAHYTDLPRHMTEKLAAIREEFNQTGQVWYKPRVPA